MTVSQIMSRSTSSGFAKGLDLNSALDFHRLPRTLDLHSYLQVYL